MAPDDKATLSPDQAIPGPVVAGEVARRASRGGLVYVGRTGLVQAIQIASSLVLARHVLPAGYGLVTLGLALVAAARLLGDLGIVYFLTVQDHVSEEDERSDMLAGLTIATLSLLALVPIGIFAAPHPADVSHAEWVLPALGLTLPLAALRLTALLHCERAMHFERLGLVSVVETFVLYATQVALLFAGLGVWALVFAHVFGTMVGTALLTRGGRDLAAPARPRHALQLVKRGLPFQSTLLVTGAVGAISPIIVAAALGARGLGFWGWSTIIATPIVGLIAALQSVAMPALSRLRRFDDSRSSEATELLLRLSALIGALGATIFLGLVPDIIRLFFGARWLPAIDAVRIALLGTLPLSVSTILASRLATRGLIATRLRATILAGIATVLATWPLTSAAGVAGAAFATALLLPLLDVIVMAAVSAPPLRRAVRDAVVVGAPMTAASWFAGSLVSDIPSLVLACALLGMLGILLAWLADAEVVRTTVRFARG
jgi:O-antigen/teichoic acid export membrane protein